MEDLFDYLRWRGDLTFSQVPPNAVDALIFSALSYLSFGGAMESQPDVPVTLRDASEEFFRMEDAQDRCRLKIDLSLLMAASETVRFGETGLVHYRSILIPEEDTQFAAISYLLDNGEIFITFRGTDYSLTGWKEDFNMSFQESIPAQRLAVAYTQEIGETFSGNLYLGGHSKGGNLAVFAGVKSPESIRSRILAIYNQDGPGFTDFVMRDPVYPQMVPKIHTIIPQSSVIGMLLEHEEPYTVVKSKQIGLLQHDPYSWVLRGPEFVTMEEITNDSRFLDMTIKNWLAEMNTQERNEIVDTVFDLLTIENASSVFDLIHPKHIRSYLKALSTDGKTRRRLTEEILSLIEAARKTQMELEGFQSEAQEPVDNGETTE